MHKTAPRTFAMLTAAGNATEFIFFLRCCQLCNCRCRLLSVFGFLLQHEAYFLHSALFCVCSLAATSPGFANNNNRLVQGLTKYSFWLRRSLLSLPLMLIGRSELTKLVAHPHKEPNICCLIRPDKNTHVTFVSPL